ncbi:MAG TPA: GAF domain-containing protein [Methylomirabilota bacterium]
MELPTRGGRRSPKSRSRLLLDEHLGKPGALSTLARVSVATRDKRECFSEIAKAAATLLRARAVAVWIDTGRILRSEGTFTTDVRRQRRPIAFGDVQHGDGMVGRVFWARGPEYVADVQTDRRWVDHHAVRAQGLHALAALPLITDRVVGVLAILFPDRRDFTADEKDVMTFLADQAAVAIEHARRVGIVERRGRVADAVVDLLCAAHGGDGGERAAERIVHAAASLFEPQRVSVYEMDPASGDVVLVRARGAGSADAESVRELDLVELAVRNARPMMAATDAASGHASAAGSGPDAARGISALAVPIKTRSMVVGALALVAAPDREFDPGTIELAERLAIGAAALLTPSRTGEEPRRSARASDEPATWPGGIVWEADAGSGRFTFVSRRAEVLTGYPLAEWRRDADFWRRLVHPDDRLQAGRRRADAMRAGADFDLEYRIVTKSGREIHVRDSARAVRDARGMLRQWRGVMVELPVERAASVTIDEAGEHVQQLPLL